jgi:tellurite resistance protein TerB
MPNKYSRDRYATIRLELLSSLIEYRGAKLMEATVAGCAVVALADGEVSPQETARMLSVMGTDPLMSMFPRDSIASEFDTYVWAWQENARVARDAALQQIGLLALQPRLGRIVMQACIDVTQADGQVHPRELEAIAQVREALGLDPEPAVPLGAPQSPSHNGAELSPAA